MGNNRVTYRLVVPDIKSLRGAAASRQELLKRVRLLLLRIHRPQAAQQAAQRVHTAIAATKVTAQSQRSQR